MELLENTIFLALGAAHVTITSLGINYTAYEDMLHNYKQRDKGVTAQEVINSVEYSYFSGEFPTFTYAFGLAKGAKKIRKLEKKNNNINYQS